MTPKELAAKVFAEMTDEEKATAREYGAGDMQDKISGGNHGWAFMVSFLDEIDRLCGYEGEETS